MKFYKRFLSLILAFILIFSISVPCYASDTNSDQSDPAGWNSWSFNDKVIYVTNCFTDFICGFTGIVHGDPSSFKQLAVDLYANQPEAGVYNLYEYFANGLSFDDSTETWILSDDLVTFLNELITNYNDQVTMTYRYPVQVTSIQADTFPSQQVYQFLVDLCLAYPDCYVFTPNADQMKMSYKGQPSQLLDGSYTEGWGTSLFDNLCMFCVIPKPFAGTSQYTDLYAASTLFYNNNWEVSFSPKCFWVAPDGRCFYKTSGIYNNSYVLAKQFESGDFPNLDDVADYNYWSWYGTSYSMYLDNKRAASWSARTVYSAAQDALNVYKSEADMKKDIGSQFVGSYTNTYTGTTVNNITQTEINNIVNNYYPSDPDPDPNPDDPGGGGSGSDSKDYTFLLQRIISEIQNLNFSDLNDTLKEIKVLVSNISQNLYDFSDMDSNISEMNKSIKDILEQLQDLNDNLVALSRALVGKDTFEDALSGVKSKIPDDIILASVNELVELQEEALSFGGALGDIFSKLLDFQTGIDDLVQDEEYIDEVEDLLRQLLPKDPEDNEDDSFFDKVLKTIEMSLQLYANSVDEIKETSKKKFPFSIGYDIELLLMLLSAEPQTPVFTIPFEYDRINYKSEIVIDFSMFDDSIDVIRFFLTIYYCFFLLMITPKMIGLNNEVDS